MTTSTGHGAATGAAVDATALANTRLSRALVAGVRIVLALMWIQNVFWKVPPDFGKERGADLYQFTNHAVERPVFPPYSWIVEHVVLPNFALFGWLVLFTEAALGAFLLIGLATRFWALVGIGQTLAITLSVLNTSGEWHWSYYLMLVAHVAVFAVAAGRAGGLDGVLRPLWLASPGRLPRLLARAS